MALHLGFISLAALAGVGAASVASERPARTAAAAAPATSAAAVREHGATAVVREPASETPTADAASTGAPAGLVGLETIGARGIPEEVAWVTDAPYSLRDLSRTWAIPRATLTTLNPALPTQERVPAGTRVTVYSRTLGADFSVGAPNAGRLVRGVPMPQSAAWELTRGRARTYGTAETISNVTAALTAYAGRFPDAAPVEVGDISTRRGGKLDSHQSHQSGRDVDIRLVLTPASDGLQNGVSQPRFAAARNWFLVKSLIDGGGVQAIYLNASEQAWLRSAAEADVGVERTARYFDLIRHQRGHKHHLHVRFACPDEHRRCINYSR